MTVIYNENDRGAAQWLRELIKAGHLPKGYVNERSIVDLTADDVRHASEAHFFAGIGGWPYALRLAGVPVGASVWSGSCPCQPFSVAGKGRGVEDERHLWPVWRELISECRPGFVFGEQVASPAGKSWLDAVQTDLEALGYAFWAADLCAAGIGAPHIRQRLFWGAVRVGNPHGKGARRDSGASVGAQAPGGQSGQAHRGIGDLSGAPGATGRVVHADGERHQGARLQLRRGQPQPEVPEAGGASTSGNPWGRVDWLPCRDGKTRPAESGTFPVAHGVPGRVGLLRGYRMRERERERLLNAVREYGRRCEAMGRDAGGWTEAEARAVDAAFADVVDLVDSIVTLGVQS